MTERGVTLTDALSEEMERVRGILSYYDEIPTGVFAATMMRESLHEAEHAMLEMDAAKMVRCLEDLRGYEA